MTALQQGRKAFDFRPRQPAKCLFRAFFNNWGGSRFGQRWGCASRGRVDSGNRDQHRPPYQRAAMSDKSPRQTMTKKSGKSLKEKRAAKRAKTSQISQTESLLHTKKR